MNVQTMVEQDAFENWCCGKCGSPITTSAMALMCPRGRQCEFVADDEHWETVERCREDFGIERYKPPNK